MSTLTKTQKRRLLAEAALFDLTLGEVVMDDLEAGKKMVDDMIREGAKVLVENPRAIFDADKTHNLGPFVALMAGVLQGAEE